MSWGKEIDLQTAQLPQIAKMYEAHGLTLVRKTCACPEQYHVKKDGKQVAYLRLRHGEFRVDAPDVWGETMYEAEPLGDGMFDAEERIEFMEKALEAIITYYAIPK